MYIDRVFVRIVIAVFIMLNMSIIAVGQNIIPMPQKYKVTRGVLDLRGGLKLRYHGDLNHNRLLKSYLVNLGFEINESSNIGIEFVELSSMQLSSISEIPNMNSDEAYKLYVSKRNIKVYASSIKGFFYAIQSLNQLVSENKIPCLTVEDYPRFAYRGMHLDESRHFGGVDFVKKQLRAMARYKLNRFHWHLTDGAGWRIEIKRYPRLTNFAAWRPQQDWKSWWENGCRYCSESDPRAQGGFYTQEQIREIVSYADSLNIVVIPEIEMPGHSEEVLAAYPFLSCANDMYGAGDFCIGKEATFKFLKDVLSEVIDLFPSKYIHIGGDEAVKNTWKTCPDCKSLMKDNKIKNVDELQSYFIRKIEEFVNSKGREIIGWDEILQGGLAPNATLMCWRSEEWGIRAAKSGHKVIMTPGKYCYLDGYQSDPSSQPEAIGGYLPLEKVYSYNPIPSELSASDAKNILGVQACVWREYMPTNSHTEYMIYPRLLALSEVGWTEVENKSWEDFRIRVNMEIPKLKAMGYSPYRLSANVELETTVDRSNNRILVNLFTEQTGLIIRYTIDGSEVNEKSPIYRRPIEVKSVINIRAQSFKNNMNVGVPIFKRIDYHKAIGKKITLSTEYSKNYPASGSETLIDGYTGGKGYGDGKWLGFLNNDVSGIIDFNELIDISYVSINSIQQKGPWVWLPKYVELSISDDGKNFKQLAKLEHDVSINDTNTIFHSFVWSGPIEKARYLKIYAPVVDIDGGWVFIDEIIVQ